MIVRGGCVVVLSAWLMASVVVLGAQESQTAEKVHTVTLPAARWMSMWGSIARPRSRMS